jgi:putative acyl-CoA dehydrogenase
VVLWFCSAPMCDLFLVLARTDEGVTCFALPRVLPDGSRHAGFQLQRLKEELGNRSNASSEVEFRGALARMVGAPGRGVPTIIEMVNHTRLDCVFGAASGMRAAVANATWHAAHRSAFGAHLIEQPLMVNVLADLAIESEAATTVALRLARAYDEGAGRSGGRRLQAPGHRGGQVPRLQARPRPRLRGLECLGGNGYVEASGMPRLYREAPLASIWEGSGNVMALDVLRALAKSPEALEVFFAEVDEAAGADARLDAFAAKTRAEFSDHDAIEARARRVVERMALCLQGSLLVRHAPPAVTDAFCAARLGGDAGLNYGTLPPAPTPRRSWRATRRPTASRARRPPRPGAPRRSCWAGRAPSVRHAGESGARPRA